MSQPSLGLFGDDEPTYTVRELAEAVNLVLGRAFDEGVWVRGEIQGLQQRGGHTYFALVEDSPEGKATMSVSLFAGVAARLRPVLARHRMRLENGLTVRIGGVLDFYAPTGRLGIKMATIDAGYTIGQLMAERDRLVRALVAEGIFDANRRRPMPVAPHCIGLVTSVDSAAYHDVTHELTASRVGFRIRLADVRVQGADAPAQIAAAIATLSRDPAVELIVVVRGGGARTDLAAFDSELVARAIVTASVPVITGVGHETDTSVADAVAHTALKTPTAVAGLLVDLVRNFAAVAEQTWRAIDRRTMTHLARSEQRLALAGRGIRRAALLAVDRAAERVDVGRSRTAALDPHRALARGWTITRRPDGTLVRSATELVDGDEIVTTFATGAAHSRVEGSPA